MNAIHLAGLPNLESLSLCHTAVTEAGLEQVWGPTGPRELHVKTKSDPLGGFSGLLFATTEDRPPVIEVQLRYDDDPELFESEPDLHDRVLMSNLRRLTRDEDLLPMLTTNDWQNVGQIRACEVEPGQVFKRLESGFNPDHGNLNRVARRRKPGGRKQSSTMFARASDRPGLRTRRNSYSILTVPDR